MNSHPLIGIDKAVFAERDRCAAIAERHSKAFECKGLYNTARALAEVARAIRTEVDNVPASPPRAGHNSRIFSAGGELSTLG